MPRHIIANPDLHRAVSERELSKIKDPQLRLLKVHLLVEQILTMLLAVRLDIDKEKVPSLTFSLLAELALAGPLYATERDQVLALNRLRNYFGHDVTAELTSKQTADFLQACGFAYSEVKRILNMRMKAASRRIIGKLWLCVTDAIVHKNPRVLRNSNAVAVRLNLTAPVANGESNNGSWILV